MAAVYDLFIDQGSDSITEIVIKTDDGYVVDLTDYNVSAQFRKYPGASTYHTLLCEKIGSPINGVISVSLPGSTSSLIKAGRYLYDVEIFNSINNTKLRVLQGTLDLSPEITR